MSNRFQRLHATGWWAIELVSMTSGATDVCGAPIDRCAFDVVAGEQWADGQVDQGEEMRQQAVDGTGMAHHLPDLRENIL